MKRYAVVIVAALIGLSCLAANVQARADGQQEALAAAQQWLKLVDTGEFGKSHQSAHPNLAKMVSRQFWEEKISDMRGDLGVILSRRLRTVEYSGDIKPPPVEEFYVFAFDTEMSKGGDMEEVVACRRGESGQWQVADYYLHFKR
jgi:uncharacterized protein DUF4019